MGFESFASAGAGAGGHEGLYSLYDYYDTYYLPLGRAVITPFDAGGRWASYDVAIITWSFLKHIAMLLGL